MKLQMISRAVLGAALCIMGLGNSFVGSQDDSYQEVGISANLFNLPGENKNPTLAGLGGRAYMIGGVDEDLVRLGAEGFWGAGSNKSWMYGAQWRLGLAAVPANARIYIMGFFDGDFDGMKHNLEKRTSRVVVAGGETGTFLGSDKGKPRTFLIGVNAGIALLRGRLDQDDGSRLPASTEIHKQAASTGLSLTGRFGKQMMRGAVQIRCSGSALWGAGWHSSCSGDVNIFKNLQLGGGIRYTKLHDKNDEQISITSPFIRVTVGKF